MKETKTGLC